MLVLCQQVTFGPLSNAEAKTRLNVCIKEGRVVYSLHFREELANDGLTIGDVLDVCRSGTIRLAPDFDNRSGNWKYRIEGPVDGTQTAVVFSFRPERKAVFITVFKKHV